MRSKKGRMPVKQALMRLKNLNTLIIDH
uniref:Uncharacterized protein n=1 Tax=Anguilla anguilla TaxID=7936 RepID=A0A0E9SWD8_ANGAN